MNKVEVDSTKCCSNPTISRTPPNTKRKKTVLKSLFRKEGKLREKAAEIDNTKCCSTQQQNTTKRNDVYVGTMQLTINIAGNDWLIAAHNKNKIALKGEITNCLVEYCYCTAKSVLCTASVEPLNGKSWDL